MFGRRVPRAAPRADRPARGSGLLAFADLLDGLLECFLCIRVLKLGGLAVGPDRGASVLHHELYINVRVSLCVEFGEPGTGIDDLNRSFRV